MRDYDELVRVLRMSGGDDVQMDAADAIEELVEMVPRWISVKERLPEKRFAVLIYCPYNKCIYTAYLDGENWVHFGGGNIEYVPFPVTHWMPLPAPPKEVE